MSEKIEFLEGKMRWKRTLDIIFFKFPKLTKSMNLKLTKHNED